MGPVTKVWKAGKGSQELRQLIPIYLTIQMTQNELSPVANYQSSSSLIIKQTLGTILEWSKKFNLQFLELVGKGKKKSNPDGFTRLAKHLKNDELQMQTGVSGGCLTSLQEASFTQVPKANADPQNAEQS